MIGFVGPAGLECDPLIMSLLYSTYYPLRKSRIICVKFNINRGLCVYNRKINCSLYVKYYTGLHGFAEILAKILAPLFIAPHLYIDPVFLSMVLLTSSPMNFAKSVISLPTLAFSNADIYCSRLSNFITVHG